MQILDLIADLPLTANTVGGPISSLQRLLDGRLSQVFRPMECHAVVSRNGTPLSSVDTGDEPWPGEIFEGGPMSRLTGPSAVTPGILDLLPDGDRYAVRLVGGLRFVEPALAPEPDWYGRAVGCDGRAVLFIAYLQFHWNDLWREIRLSFPALGYPLSGQLPSIGRDGKPSGTQMSDVVARNRRSLIEAFAGCTTTLGYEPEDVGWWVEAEEDTPSATRDEIAALVRQATGRL